MNLIFKFSNIIFSNIISEIIFNIIKVSDDEDEDAFIQRHNLEILKASVEAKDKHAHQKAFYDENTTDNDDISTTNYEINGNNGNGRRNSRRRKKLLTAEEEAHLGKLSASSLAKETLLNAVMDGLLTALLAFWRHFGSTLGVSFSTFGGALGGLWVHFWSQKR